MRKMFIKELRLSASKLSFFFIAFALMTLLPGYPILMGTFFVSFGIFQTFQYMREANDIAYSALLPISKADIVRGKFMFAVFIEMCGFAVMVVLTLLRMTVLRHFTPYVTNALMTANPVFLAFSLVLFGTFNLIFIAGFFKTAYYYGKPFIFYIIVMIVTVGVAETLHHIPGLEAVNAFGFEHAYLQWGCFATGALIYVLLTAVALKLSMKRFEIIDL